MSDDHAKPNDDTKKSEPINGWLVFIVGLILLLLPFLFGSRKDPNSW